MSVKLTSYQRLKQENEELKRNIQVLVFEPDSVDARSIKAGYLLSRNIENMVMAGDVEPMATKQQTFGLGDYLEGKRGGVTITGMQMLGTDMSKPDGLFNREFNAGEGLEDEVEDTEAVVVDKVVTGYLEYLAKESSALHKLNDKDIELFNNSITEEDGLEICKAFGELKALIDKYPSVFKMVYYSDKGYQLKTTNPLL